MQTFKEEARPDPHPRSPEVLRSLAKVRGSEAGFYLAESFMIKKCLMINFKLKKIECCPVCRSSKKL